MLGSRWTAVSTRLYREIKAHVVLNTFASFSRRLNTVTAPFDMSASAQPTRGNTVPLPGGIPPNHKEHTEAKTTILVPTDHTAFLNPTQQFNRDLSVAVIRAWNERRKERLEAKYESKKSKKGKKKGKQVKGEEGDAAATTEEPEQPVAGPSTETKKPFKAPNIKIIEALSATGLRSIRYAKEIPDVKYVLANDLSPSACEAMKMNIAYNGVGEDPVAETAEREQNAVSKEGQTSQAAVEPEEQAVNGSAELPYGRRAGCRGKVRVNEGDACDLMYAHRQPAKRVEVVDLDPYGTAAPFIDAAIGCIADGGLLCVTCTDVAVLAGSQYPEKAFSNYGGACVNAEYSHEVALRLVLNSLAQAAARYGRHITPLLSFSIDFYVRLFVTVDTGANQVKDLASKTGLAHICSHCQSYVLQPFGRIVERENKAGGLLKVHRAAQTVSNDGCPECGSTQHVGGPMWLDAIHDSEFADRVLKSIDGQKDSYNTWARMHGMLTLAKNEIEEPFYFTANRVGSHFKSTSAPSSLAVNALLNAGYKLSRSHASAGSIKTDAPRSFVFDIAREFIKTHPVNLDKIPERNPARNLHAKGQTHEIDFTPHPDAAKFERGEKVVYYQENPLPNWGPGSRARSVRKAPEGSSAAAPAADSVVSTAAEAEKRKAEDGEDMTAKKPKLGE